MELFTLGVDEYTQADVTDLARALTGWTVQGYTGADNYNGARFLDNPAFHDNGVKTILGQTGNWNGYDAIRIILEASDEQGSVSGRFLSRKLWTYFAYHDPPDWVVQELTGVYVSSGRSIRAVVDHLFRMPEFYEAHARKVLVRSPVEYTVGAPAAARGEDRHVHPRQQPRRDGAASLQPVRRQGPRRRHGLDQHGNGLRPRLDDEYDRDQPAHQRDADRPRAALGRKDAGDADGRRQRPGGPARPRGRPAQAKAAWAKYVDSKSDGSRGYWQNTSAQVDQKVRGLIHLMLTSSDYHLC